MWHWVLIIYGIYIQSTCLWLWGLPGKLDDPCGWGSHGPALKDVNIQLQSRRSNRARLLLAVFNEPNVEYLHLAAINYRFR